MNFFRLISCYKNLANGESSIEKIECYCSDSQGFYLTKRQASITTSIIIILFTIMLIIGYLWGQRNAIQEFTSKVINDSFADQVNYSMYSMYGENISSDDSESKDLIDTEKIIDPISKEVTNDINSQHQIENQPNANKTEHFNKYPLIHYAQLIGFGSRKSAEQFVNKLQKKGYTLYIETKKSKNSKGKVISWYQVVTEKFENKAKLDEIVNEIKSLEHLSGIKFMTTEN